MKRKDVYSVVVSDMDGVQSVTTFGDYKQACDDALQTFEMEIKERELDIDDFQQRIKEKDYTIYDWNVKVVHSIHFTKEKKALVLLFSVDEFNLDELDELTPEARYERAVEGVADGKCDIYTIADLCGDINNEADYFGEWFAYPCYVDEDEYNKWMK